MCSVLTSPAFGNIELLIEPLCDCGCDAETVSCFSILYTPVHTVERPSVCLCFVCVRVCVCMCVFCVDKRGRDTYT